MNSTLPHLRHGSKSSHLAGMSPGSPKSLLSGICRTGVRKIPRGFTLVEIAIAIFIITILLGSILVPLTTQVEQRQVAETQKMLEDIKEALIGHAIAKGHLPCPDRPSGGAGGANDTANDGVEDFAAGVCYTGTAAGNVPWVTLGLGTMDPWGNRFRYKVTGAYAQRAPVVLNLSTAATLTVITTSGGSLLTGTNPDGAVAVIFSHGKNGFGAISASTGTANPPPSSLDELDNSAGGGGYTSRPTYRPDSNTPAELAKEFDDIVTWLGKYTLFNRMVAAGKLP